MKTTMLSWQAIVARVIGIVIAVAIGTILVVVVTIPLQLQELGIFIAFFYLFLFWGCSPGLLIPFIVVSISRRISPGRVIIGALIAGGAFPVCLGTAWFGLLILLGNMGMVDDPDQLLGTFTDVRLWLVFIPIALVFGIGLSSIVFFHRGERGDTIEIE